MPQDAPTRRRALGLGLGGLAAAGLGSLGGVDGVAAAPAGRVLKISTLPGFAAVNVPMQTAFRSILGTMTGYAAPELQPTAKIPQIVQQVLAGSAEMGDGDVASTMAASEAGSDVRIIGLSYNNISMVVVVNGAKHDSLESLAKAGGVIAVSGIGDFMYVMIRGVFKKRGLDVSKVNFVELGSGGDRVRALLAGRVDAIPMHIEDVAPVQSRGNYKIVVRPWEVYDDWFSAVLMARASWLEKDENKAAAVAVLKSALTSFRRSNEEFEWYKARTHDYASSEYLKTSTDEILKPIWQTLSREVKAFPRSMEQMNVDEFAKVIPIYKEVGALKGTVDLAKLIDRTYVDQAAKELG